jgi:hypothetical protein
MRGRLPADGSEPDASELRRFEDWAIKVTDALESHPDYLAEFQRTLTPGAEPDSGQIANSTTVLEEIVRELEARLST